MMTMVGYVPMPRDFKYMNVFLKGKPRHQGLDPFCLKHPAMDCGRRAKIFSPFDALKGFSEAVASKDILYINRPELGDEDKAEINRKLGILYELTRNGKRARENKVTVKVTYFVTCTDKNNSAYGNAFFAAVGEGDIDVNEIKEYILTEEQRRQEALEAAQAQEALKSHRVDATSKDDILVLNAKDLKGLDYRMARCCNPVFGDDVFGFVTRESGIKIHRITCPNAARLIETYPYRIQKVRWADSPSSGSFQVSLKITTDQESEALNKIMEVVGTFKASIRTFNVQENQRQGTYDILMKLLVPSNLELDKILSQIRAQKHVLKVNRL